MTSLKSIASGDSCNEGRVSFPLHLGTHVDAPRHFDSQGPTVEMYAADFWHATNVYLLDVPAEPQQVIGLSEVSRFLDQIPADCEFLLVRTGAEAYRQNRPEIYSASGPCLGDDFAEWLRSQRNLRFVGVDSISVSSMLHRALGRRTHSELLAKSGRPPVLIVEDMHLSELQVSPHEAWVHPLRVDGADGSPVTVVARID